MHCKIKLDGVIAGDLKPSKHFTETAKGAKKILGFIDKTFKFKSRLNYPLYNSLVCPHPEYHVHFWSSLLEESRRQIGKSNRSELSR